MLKKEGSEGEPPALDTPEDIYKCNNGKTTPYPMGLCRLCGNVECPHFGSDDGDYE